MSIQPESPIVRRHPWDLTPKEAVALQRELASEVRLEPLHSEVSTIAGVDVSIRKDRAAAAIVVTSYPDLEVVHVDRHELPTPFPYVPGLLSFREIPALLPLFERIGEMPDVIMVDGQGIAHPRRFGLAAHLGVVLDHPCFGVAKTRLVGTHNEPASDRGSREPLYDAEEIIGAVVRTRAQVKPVFVSSGHRVTLQDAVDLTLTCAPRYKLPEPARLAHRLSKTGSL